MSRGGCGLAWLAICRFFHLTACRLWDGAFRHFIQKHRVPPSLQGLGNALGGILMSKGTNANPIILFSGPLARSNVGFWKPGFDLLEHHVSLLTSLKCTYLYFEEYGFVL